MDRRPCPARNRRSLQREPKFIDRFVRHVNAHGQDTGLPEIPDDHIAPHQFRQTIPMLVGNEPGAEITLGLQLKHVEVRVLANRSTQGCAASDTRWTCLPDMTSGAPCWMQGSPA
ncbi:hypothetical protein OG586_28485 [Streptomyces murinus]|uniref:hypothetical protein n=1 Tax=Streptomyces murinus TaxID=33900 RepID=UPI002E8040A8|nr:hypothetical protein [Streptomyces murinus]WUD09894.1 hypothetical protein OG586_28485 [Streptomyces murinus]